MLSFPPFRETILSSKRGSRQFGVEGLENNSRIRSVQDAQPLQKILSHSGNRRQFGLDRAPIGQYFYLFVPFYLMEFPGLG